MCKNDKCERHEFDYGFCLPHLKEDWIAKGILVIEEPKPKRKSRKKKVDAVEVTTTDATEGVETREGD